MMLQMQENQLKKFVRNSLVDLLDRWAVIVSSTSTTSTWESARTATWHSTWHAASFAASSIEFPAIELVKWK
jgi:hypothetical protein